MIQRVASKFSLPTFLLLCLALFLGAVFYSYEYFLQAFPGLVSSAARGRAIYQAVSFAEFFAVAYIVAQLFVGVLVDRFGLQRLLSLACGLCAIGAFLLSVAHQWLLADLAEVLMGMGAGFAFVGLLKLAAVTLPAKRFALAVGLATTVGMVSVLLSRFALKWLIGVEGWRESFALLAVFGLLLAVLLFFLLGRLQAKENAWQSGVPFDELFFHLRASLKNKQLWLLGVIGGLVFLAVALFSQAQGAFYLAVLFRVPLEVGKGLANVLLFGWLLGAPIVGFLSDRFANRVLFLRWGTAISFICLLLALCFGARSFVFLLGLLFLCGFFSSAQCLVFVLGRELLSHRIAGTAVSLVNLLVMSMAALSLPIMCHLLNSTHHFAKGRGALLFIRAEFFLAFLVLPAGLFLAFLLSFFLRKSRARLRKF